MSREGRALVPAFAHRRTRRYFVELELPPVEPPLVDDPPPIEPPPVLPLGEVALGLLLPELPAPEEVLGAPEEVLGAPVLVDGDADGLMLPLDPVLVSTPSFDIVSESGRPVTFRPSAFWKSLSAACVFGPMRPSTVPGSWPLSFSACWMALTCSWFMRPIRPMRWCARDGVPVSLAVEPDDVLEPPVVPDVVPELLVVPDDDDGDGLVLPLVCAHAGPAATSAPVMSTAKNVFHSFM